MVLNQNVSLILTIVISCIVILICVTVFVIRFSHPEDDTGFAPKIIAILVFTLTFCTMFVVPTSRIKQTDPKIYVDDNLMFIIFSICVIVFDLVIIPFSLGFFKSAFVGLGTNYLKRRLIVSSIGVFVAVVIYSIVWLSLFFTDALANKYNLFFNYMIFVFTFIGWWPFSILLGIGLIAMPLSLFFDWYYRPTPMLMDTYDECSKLLGKRAKDLRISGEKISKSYENKNFFEKKRLMNTFYNAVKVIKEDYVTLQVAYLYKGGNPIWPWVKLVFSFLSFGFSTLLIIQIIVGPILKILDILGTILSGVSIPGFFLFEFLFYFFFALFVMLSLIFGLLQISKYAPFLIAGYKLESRGTFNDSFLVNSALFLFLCLPGTHFFTLVLYNYMGQTDLDKFYKDVQASSYFNTFFVNNIFFYIIFVVIVLTSVSYAFFPPNRSKKLEESLKKLTEQ